jgi:hypothetical protein
LMESIYYLLDLQTLRVSVMKQKFCVLMIGAC